MRSIYDRHDLYRWYNKDGVLLYVGISFSALARAAQHKRNSQWFDDASYMTIEKCKNRQSALDREAEAIKLENPIWNVVGNKKDNSYIGHSYKNARENISEILIKESMINEIKHETSNVDFYKKQINELEDDIHNLTRQMKELRGKRDAIRVERNLMRNKFAVMAEKFYYKMTGASLRGRKIGDVIYL